MKEFVIGTIGTAQRVVEEDQLAVAVGSGSLPVFATPMMAAMMEEAACHAVESFLDEGETTVGTALNITHDSATPMGLTVRAEAEIVSAEGRCVTLQVTAYDSVGKIGAGEHKRFVVKSEAFLDKTERKLLIK